MTLRSRIIAAILGLLLVAPAGSVLAADSSIAPMNAASRRAYLNAKYGRTGNLDLDINLRGYMEAVEKLDVSTARGAATFWSGPGNFKQASAFARGNARSVLEMTAGGKWLQNQALFKRLPSEMAIKPWHRLSERFAEGASGEVNAFVVGARLDRTFYTIELPALKRNNAVTFINYKW